MSNNLQIYQNNSCKITQEIPAEFINESGATITLSVHSDEFLTGSTLFQVTGSTLFQVTGSTHSGMVTFNITADNNNQPIRVYFYEIILTLNSKNFIIGYGSYSIENDESININTIFNTGFTGTII